jgi:uncharacterized protein (DUF3084 family)
MTVDQEIRDGLFSYYRCLGYSKQAAAKAAKTKKATQNAQPDQCEKEVAALERSVAALEKAYVKLSKIDVATVDLGNGTVYTGRLFLTPSKGTARVVVQNAPARRRRSEPTIL